MQISSSVTNGVKDRVTKELEFVYNKLPDEENKSFDQFLQAVTDEVLAEIDNLIEVTYDNVYVYQKRRSTTKKRWYKKEVMEELGLHKEVHVVAKTLYDETLKGDTKTFHHIYKCETPEALYELRLNELESWMNDDDAPLSHFKYIKDKSSRQVISALTNDIKYVFYKEIYEKCPKGKQTNISTLPLSISNIPIDFTNRAKIDMRNVVDDGREKYFLDKYQISDTTVLESRMNVEILKTGMLQQVLKWLNAKDIEVFNYCMSVATSDKDFFTTRLIVVDIGDIVRNVYASNDSSDSYRSVKESLYRMQYLNTGVVDESLRGFTTKIFDNVEIYTTESKKEGAKIVVNIDIVSEYIKNNTISTYSDVIKNFKLSSSRVGIYTIQRERIRLATSHPNDDELIFETNYNFFRGMLYFSNKRKRRNIEAIENMLDEIVANNIAIKRYERRGDMFELVFYPISKQEREDLMGGRNFINLDSSEEQEGYFLQSN